MNVLITGANGYIGQRLIPVLLEAGHHLICCVRNKQRFESVYQQESLEVLELDLLDENVVVTLPRTIDIAYYLVHSMSSGPDFEQKELASASRFINLLEQTTCRQLIYLSGIVNEAHLSKHLGSRLAVERLLNSGKVPVTTLRAGIIIGSGSASFEIMRDLVEKLPVMIAPRWLNTLCQPIAIRNVIQFLAAVGLQEHTFNKNYDIGGPAVLSYKEMLIAFARVRQLKRKIFILPVMTPRLSSYWLFFITSTSYSLAVNLVNSMKVNVTCRPNDLARQFGIELLPYKAAVELAFEKIDQQLVLSSWKDAFISSNSHIDLVKYIKVPVHGCFQDRQWIPIETDPTIVLSNIWSIGGKRGWYYANHLWKARGMMDKLFGGVGLRRGRTHDSEIGTGDALDFWRVLIADKKNRRLLLFAEMKLPGEAWLEFRITRKHNKLQLVQTATFRPRGLWGRLYWLSMLPFHYFIFRGMAKNLVKESSTPGSKSVRLTLR